MWWGSSQLKRAKTIAIFCFVMSVMFFSVGDIRLGLFFVLGVIFEGGLYLMWKRNAT